jgi:ABC-type multidrug transport system ATPase subunit
VTRRFGLEVALERVDASFPRDADGRDGPVRLGKSTLLALLAGLDTPTRGGARRRGRLSRLDRDARAAFRREHIGVVGQDARPLGVLTARENVELVLGLRGIDGVEAHERAMDALAIVEARDHAARAVDRLSRRERERVALARAIAPAPGPRRRRADGAARQRRRRSRSAASSRTGPRARHDRDLRDARPAARDARGVEVALHRAPVRSA